MRMGDLRLRLMCRRWAIHVRPRHPWRGTSRNHRRVRSRCCAWMHTICWHGLEARVRRWRGMWMRRSPSRVHRSGSVIITPWDRSRWNTGGASWCWRRLYRSRSLLLLLLNLSRLTQIRRRHTRWRSSAISLIGHANRRCYLFGICHRCRVCRRCWWRSLCNWRRAIARVMPWVLWWRMLHVWMVCWYVM